MATHKASNAPEGAAPGAGHETHGSQLPPARPIAGGPAVVIPRTRNPARLNRPFADCSHGTASADSASLIGSNKSHSAAESLAASVDGPQTQSGFPANHPGHFRHNRQPLQKEAGLWKYPTSDGPMPHRSESVAGHTDPRQITSNLPLVSEPGNDSEYTSRKKRGGLRSKSTPPIMSAPYDTAPPEPKEAPSNLSGDSRSFSRLISVGNTSSVHEALHYSIPEKDLPTSIKGTTELDKESRITRNEARLTRMRESHAKAERCALELEMKNEDRINARIDAFKCQSDSYNNTFAGINNKPLPRRGFLFEAGHREMCHRNEEIYASNPVPGSTKHHNPTKQEAKIHTFLRAIANS